MIVILFWVIIAILVDSRDFGPIDKRQIVGKIIMKIYPFNK